MTQMIERSEIQQLSAIKSKKVEAKSYHSQGSMDRAHDFDQDLEMVHEAAHEEQDILTVGSSNLRPKPLVLTGPSGAGKSTLTNYIM